MESTRCSLLCVTVLSTWPMLWRGRSCRPPTLRGSWRLCASGVGIVVAGWCCGVRRCRPATAARERRRRGGKASVAAFWWGVGRDAFVPLHDGAMVCIDSVTIVAVLAMLSGALSSISGHGMMGPGPATSSAAGGVCAGGVVWGRGGSRHRSLQPRSSSVGSGVSAIDTGRAITSGFASAHGGPSEASLRALLANAEAETRAAEVRGDAAGARQSRDMAALLRDTLLRVGAGAGAGAGGPAAGPTASSPAARGRLAAEPVRRWLATSPGCRRCRP